MQLLAIDQAATFVISNSRIQRENDPDHSPGPRLAFAGCADGGLVCLRHDVAEDIAQAIHALIRRSPPWPAPDMDLPWLETAADLLAAEAPIEAITRSLIYHLPHALNWSSDLRFVYSGAPEGDALMETIRRDGVPPALFDDGFVGIGDFWTPWCAAFEGGEIAALAFAARLGDEGVELGLHTFPAFRGRGIGAAVTAAWSRHAALTDHALFYSTLTTNHSSQRVTERLKLPRLGAGLRIT